MSIDALAGQIRQALEGRRTTEQRMFGGICFMIDGNMAVCASRDGLLVRVGKDGMAAALQKTGARPMIMGERTMAGYVYVSEEAINGKAALVKWLDEAVAFVATLPAKKASAAKKAAGGTAATKPRRRAR